MNDILSLKYNSLFFQESQFPNKNKKNIKIFFKSKNKLECLKSTFVLSGKDFRDTFAMFEIDRTILK